MALRREIEPVFAQRISQQGATWTWHRNGDIDRDGVIVRRKQFLFNPDRFTAIMVEIDGADAWYPTKYRLKRKRRLDRTAKIVVQLE